MPQIQTIEGFDMPIEQIFEKAEDAPEYLRSHLTEANGKFVFKAELPTEVTGLKSALEAERKAKADLEKLAKQFEGIDPAKAKEMIANAKKAEEDAAKAKGDWDNWKAQMQGQFDQEKATLTTRLTETESALEAELITARATSAIAAEKGVPALLLPHVGAKVVNENGKREVRIFDAAGQTRYGKDGKPMTIAERVAEMKQDAIFGRAFEGTGAGGSGAPNHTAGGGGSGRTLSRAAFDQLAPAEKMKFAKDGGQLTE